MNKVIRHRRLKIISLMILGAGSLLFAAAVFVPSNTPTLMLGQYALKNNDLLLGKTAAYRPFYENGAWQGDIIEYEILTDGTRQTDAAVGANPATAGTSGMCNFSDEHAGSGCWTARASFIANGADAADGSYWQNRNIFTNNSGQVNFTWDNLSPVQREAVDKQTYDTILALNSGDAALAASDTSRNTADASEILNYVRGKRLHEKINDTVSGSSGNFRSRYSVLGDITGSPVFIGPPREPYGSLEDYITFSTNYANRDGRIAVGANDGMLHVFDEDDGSEVFAYVPSMVLDKLGKLTGSDTTYDHTYYVAGDLLSASAYFDSAWHTVLVGGGGPGFAGLYALDMTEDTYDASEGTDNKLLFEKTSSDGFGHIYGRPQIGALGADSDTTPSWYIFSGSGYSTSSGHDTALKIISLDTGTVYSISTGTTGGLSTPALLNTDVDNMVELAFAGDINGDLWMFTLDQTNPDNSTVIKVYDGDPDQPITSAPTIGAHPYLSGYMVYFGTGSLLSMDDALNDGLRDGGNPSIQTDYTKEQSIIGIWIDTENADTILALTSTPYTFDPDSGHPDLQTQTLVETTGTFNQVVETLRITPTENPLVYNCISDSETCNANLYKGWKVDLPNCGERIIGSPFLRAKRVQFLTTNPTGPADACGSQRFPGDSWIMSLDWLYGTANDTVVYNLTPDAALDNDDKVTYNEVLEAPVGINLGPGVIAQPTFARLEYGIDKMYINGVFLSIPPIPSPGPLLGGHIDVETDSPSNGVIATNHRNKHSEGYNITEYDGLGGAVDGHVHDYDTMHDVEYVDLFQLEPRRGKANLVASLSSTQDASCSSTTENQKGVRVGSSCLEAIEGELNRAYDTLHTDQDGVSDPLNGTGGYGVLQSEVNSLGADPDFTDPVPATQFIITLANADKSNAAYIQIGCKAWPVVEYQNMITGKLLDGRTDTTGLVDDDNESLIFTLADIINDYPFDGATSCSEDDIPRELRLNKGLSSRPTLRIGFGQRSILDEGVHATRSQCVLGLHDPADTVCYTDGAVLSAAESALATDPDPDYSYSSCNDFVGIAIPPDDYIRDPARNLHITHARASELGHYLGDCGYRWRNGALTVQLIDASIDPSTDLQSLYRISGGGTHVKAYEVTNCGDLDYNNNDVEPYDSAPDPGLLYEATMYWHYSDLVDKIRNSDPDGNTTPSDSPCYGDPNYGGKNNIDTGGLTLGEYQALTSPLVDQCENWVPPEDEPDKVCDLERFGQLLEIIDNADSEAILNQALLELAELLGQNQALADYADMRDYAGDKIPEHQKLTIDQQQCVGTECDTDATSDDGTPNDIELYEDSTPELAGPNSVFGRRNWIDLRQ
jgi:hypothetical protein